VDAYPKKDGKIVDGLKAEDFEVFEDGKPQKVETLRFFRVEAHTPDPEVHDPNTVTESLERVADPANRVFVIYLDKYHVTIAGSHNARKPLVDMLDRILAPNDLFGVMVPDMRPRDLAFGRKLTTTAEDLARYWPWGDRDSIMRTADDQQLDACFGSDPRSGQPVYVDDGGVRRFVGDVLRDRRHEDATLTSLNDLVTYLGQIREERKAVLVFTGGWRLFGQAPGLETLLVSSGGPPIGQRGGTLGILNQLGGGSQSACNTELSRLSQLDDQQRLRQIITRANRLNVTFYPVSPEGLVVFDTPINETPVQPGPDPSVGILGWEVNNTRARSDAMRVLAANTDGIAVVNTNDLKKGLQAVTDDLSAYYVLGYYSTNTKFDGKFRRIEVKLKPQGAKVTARRGYTAPTSAEMSARAAMPTATPEASTVPAGFDEAMAVLARLRPSSDLFGYGVTSGAGQKTLAFVAEVSNGQLDAGHWAKGADVEATVTTGAGAAVGSAQARLEPGTRGALVQVPLGDASGPWRVKISVRDDVGGSLEDTFAVASKPASLLGDPIVSRGGPGGRAKLQPVADFEFRRSERVHVEWAETVPLDQRQARLLDRSGKPLPIEVTITERPSGDGNVLAADVTLAPLAPGDYILEVTAAAGSATVRKLVAIRVGS
jgi:VWFA-related protein